MTHIVLEQILYGGHGPGGYQFLARSPGVRDEWLAEAERLCTGFGERPAGVRCPAAVFAQPLGPRHVAIVRVADQGTDDTGRPGALAFSLLLVTRADYLALGGDLFEIADRYPPAWEARGELPTLTWTAGPPPPRKVEQIQQVLQRLGGSTLFPEEEVPRGGSQVLLGGCQVLVDGGRIVFERPAPDTDLMRSLWLLLPTSTRASRWPASFAFGNALEFDAVVTPRYRAEEYPHYKTEAEAVDYPEGRYELNLQIAVEAGRQRDLDALLGRRSQTETLRLVLLIVGVLLFLLVLVRLLPWQGAELPPATASSAKEAGLEPPPAGPYPTPSAEERRRLTEILQQLAVQLGVTVPASADAEQLLDAIDRRLGTPDPQRSVGPLAEQGPLARQVRVLLWKHGIADYRNPALNTVELAERLQRQVASSPASSRQPTP